MPANTNVLPEVYSAAEIGLAAGVDADDVVRWAVAHNVQPLTGGFYSTSQAVQIVRHLLEGSTRGSRRRELFEREIAAPQRPGLPLAMTTAVHIALVAALAMMTTAALPARHVDAGLPAATQLVFLATPGPGGGGGGGGRRETTRASRAERKGADHLRSPLRRQPAAERPEPAFVEPPAPKPEPPSVIAPVVPVEPDARDAPGEPVEVPSQPESRGPGAGSEAGSGSGAGIGPGAGPGVGAGTGGGAGGGPYRPWSGITPPSLLREVKPDYTDEGRRRSVEGEVELEIVVRSDGSVGDVTLRRGLGAGLDQRAIDAVRQWRFAPATRQGVPVDVIVQVSVEFRLR